MLIYWLTLFFGFHFILTYEFIKPLRAEIFTLKIHSIQGISIQQDSFMYYIKFITTTTTAVHKKAALSLTFFSFLTFIWCLFWLLFYMAQNLRKKYISLCRRKMRENARTRLVPVNTEHLKANKIFFSMKAATIHEEIWKLYSVFRRFFFFLSSLTIGKITKAELFCSLTVGYGVRFRSKYFFWLILS